MRGRYFHALHTPNRTFVWWFRKRQEKQLKL
jgi:hypothetical protein